MTRKWWDEGADGAAILPHPLIVFTAVRLAPLQRRLRLLAMTCTGLVPLVAAPWANGMERVNLRNGFSYDCVRHEPLDGVHIRLFLAPEGTAPSGYVDVASEAVASTEMLPDPPRISAAANPASAPSPLDLRTILAHAGTAHDIDAELLASVVHAESGGRATAISRVGAVGLMQLMPGTAAALGVADAFRPDQNVAGGTAYLDQLLRRYHDNLALALAAYNAGPAAVDRYHGIPPFRETRAYVARVMNEFKRRKLALEQTARNEAH